MTKDNKIVVICGDDNIICASILNNLSTQDGWTVVQLHTEQELDDLVQNNAVSQVAVVIVVHQENQFILSSDHLKLLQEHSNVKLVAISLENNMMEVYNKQNVLIRNASDFIHIIHD